MNKLVASTRFKRSLRRYTKRNIRLLKQVELTIRMLEEDMFAPKLQSHLLRGELDGLWACSYSYDCRVVFAVEDEVILLLDIGTHDEVY